MFNAVPDAISRRLFLLIAVALLGGASLRGDTITLSEAADLNLFKSAKYPVDQFEGGGWAKVGALALTTAGVASGQTSVRSFVGAEWRLPELHSYPFNLRKVSDRAPTSALVGIGLIGLGLGRRRRKR
jgi:hypothetical protein